MAKSKKHPSSGSTPADTKPVSAPADRTGLPASGQAASNTDTPAGGGYTPLELPERTAAKWIAVLFLALGAAVAAYLSYGHLQLTYGTKSFESLCNISETFNCDTVNTSDYSELFGLPIAVYAIPTYLVLAFLILRSRGRRGEDEAAPLSFAFGISMLTVLTSLGLAYVSIFLVKAVCLFCISLYAVNLVTFAMVWAASRRSFGANLAQLFTGLGRHPGLVVQAALVLLLAGGISFAAERTVQHRLLAETQHAADKEASSGAPKADMDGLVASDDASYGPNDAKVTVVEFADFQCGYCKRMSYTLKALKDEYGDRVRFVFKNFPMSPRCNDAVHNDKHPYACGAARAGVCANRLGRFWDFHDLTYKNQRNLLPDDLLTYATQVGIDPDKFKQCLDDPTVDDVIKKDIADSRPYSITGTPRVFINGQQFKGVVPREVLENAILKALGEAQKAPVKATQAEPEADPLQAPPMQQLKLGDHAYAMDTFEASHGQKGEAVSAPDQVPLFHASWYEAKAACEAAGKRLCSQEEWIAACQNAAVVDDNHNNKLGDDLIEGTEFSYSDFYEDRVCNDRQDSKDGKVAYTGNFPRCHTPTGIYDMNGNVQEWVGLTEDTALLMGGTFYDGEKASCFRIQDTFGPGFANKGTGFRCCKD